MNLPGISTSTPATLDDLMRFAGKAELIAGKIVPLMLTLNQASLEARLSR